MQKLCPSCSLFFSPLTSRANYCSKPCRIKASNIKRREIKRIWNIQNKESIRCSQQRWLENNQEKRKQVSASYMKRNTEYYRQYSSLRSRKVKHAQPYWADKELLLDIYKEATYLGLEVDHIIPITHKLVCGLHVPNNLQLLTRSQNAKKSNRFDEDILAVISS